LQKVFYHIVIFSHDKKRPRKKRDKFDNWSIQKLKTLVHCTTLMIERQSLIGDFRPVLPLQGMLNAVPLCTLIEALAGNSGNLLNCLAAATLDPPLGVTMPTRPELESLCEAALEMAEDSPLLPMLPPKVSGIDRKNLVAALIVFTMEDPFPFYRLVTQPLNVKGVRSKALLTNQMPYLKLLTVALRSVPRNSKYWCDKVLYRGVSIEGNPALKENYDNFEIAYAPGVKMTLSAPTSTSTKAKIAATFAKGIQAMSILYPATFNALRSVQTSAVFVSSAAKRFGKSMETCWMRTPCSNQRLTGCFATSCHPYRDVHISPCQPCIACPKKSQNISK